MDTSRLLVRILSALEMPRSVSLNRMCATYERLRLSGEGDVAGEYAGCNCTVVRGSRILASLETPVPGLSFSFEGKGVTGRSRSLSLGNRNENGEDRAPVSEYSNLDGGRLRECEHYLDALDSSPAQRLSFYCRHGLLRRACEVLLARCVSCWQGIYVAPFHACAGNCPRSCLSPTLFTTASLTKGWAISLRF